MDMAMISAPDGCRLYVEDTGRGVPILFLHEFAGDHRAWEPQVRRFSRSNRCITFAARGYLPSDVPNEPERYGQEAALADAIAILDALDIERAHIVGHSMAVSYTHSDAADDLTRVALGGRRILTKKKKDNMTNYTLLILYVLI